MISSFDFIFFNLARNNEKNSYYKLLKYAIFSTALKRRLSRNFCEKKYITNPFALEIINLDLKFQMDFYSGKKP